MCKKKGRVCVWYTKSVCVHVRERKREAGETECVRVREREI